MIKNFRHKGLKALYEKDDASGLDPRWLKRIRSLLTRLDASTIPEDMDFPGLRLHRLKGELGGFYAVDVSGNWRMIFRFEGEDAADVDLVDYH